jgi:hypothetical protein
MTVMMPDACEQDAIFEGFMFIFRIFWPRTVSIFFCLLRYIGYDMCGFYGVTDHAEKSNAHETQIQGRAAKKIYRAKPTHNRHVA